MLWRKASACGSVRQMLWRNAGNYSNFSDHVWEMCVCERERERERERDFIQWTKILSISILYVKNIVRSFCIRKLPLLPKMKNIKILNQGIYIAPYKKTTYLLIYTNQLGPLSRSDVWSGQSNQAQAPLLRSSLQILRGISPSRTPQSWASNNPSKLTSYMELVCPLESILSIKWNFKRFYRIANWRST